MNKEITKLKFTIKDSVDCAFTLAKVKSSGKGFTLAEVLITLGIIGVVAVLVVVPFIKDIKDKDLATSATVFEKRFEEALKVMNTQDTLGHYKTTEDFVQALSKNFKVSKICENTELNKCFNKVIYDADKNEIETKGFKLAKNLGASFETNVVGLRFANGASALLAYDPKCESNPTNNAMPVMSCVSMVYDTNGSGSPNKISSDVRLINASLENIKGGGDAIIAKINGVKITKIANSSAYGYVDCTDTEGEDYKYCEGSINTSNDFWAGAAKYCDGKENMASGKDLAKIAQYLYDDNSITASSTSSLPADTDKATELENYGFPNVKNKSFHVWFSDAYGSNIYASRRYFNDSVTAVDGGARSVSSNLAICVQH